MDDEFRAAESQYGLITREQLRLAGLSDSQIQRRVATGRLDLAHPNVFRVVGSSRSERQRLAAATLWLGSDALVSHATAGALLRLDGIATPELHVTVASNNRRGRGQDDVIVHRSSSDHTRQRRLVDGIPCTSAARTIADIAGSIDDEALEVALESARRLGLATATTVAATARSLGVWPGAATLRRVLAAAEQRPLESRLEVKLARLLRNSPLTRSVAQHPIAGFRVDRAWPELRVAVEADGFQHHGPYLFWKRDRRRVAAIEAAGWRLLHVTWDDVTRSPQQTLDRIRLALGTIAA